MCIRDRGGGVVILMTLLGVLLLMGVECESKIRQDGEDGDDGAIQ